VDAAARFESDDNSLQVQSGRYNSASEVVREALRLLEEHEQIRDLQLQELRKKLPRVSTSSTVAKASPESKCLLSLILNAIHLNSLNPRNNMLTQDAQSQTRAGRDTPQ
jgi:putative addiction module CopG family antidote